MKQYLREIITGIAAIALLAFAVIAFTKIMNRQKAGLETDIFLAVPPDTEGLLVINRPDILQRMILTDQDVCNAFNAYLPGIFGEALQRRGLGSAVFSFHRQGVLACIKPGREAEKFVREKMFAGYEPLVLTGHGLRFFFFPVYGNRFFGYCICNDILVGSYSMKLIETAAVQLSEGSGIFLPKGMKLALDAADGNAPANIIFNASGFPVPAESKGSLQWIGADLFAGENNICCYTRLKASDMAEVDSISSYLNNRFPALDFGLQTGSEGNLVALTACMAK
jgi:hypothetical protein